MLLIALQNLDHFVEDYPLNENHKKQNKRRQSAKIRKGLELIAISIFNEIIEHVEDAQREP